VMAQNWSSRDEENVQLCGRSCQLTEARCRLGGSARVPYGDSDMIAYMNLRCNITAAARSISLLGADYE
jgi:hypothetical protein